jgi:hypothetical protein
MRAKPGWAWIACAMGLVSAAPARADDPPSCGWIQSIESWNGSFAWSWSHQASWTLIPNTQVDARVIDGGSCDFELTGFPGGSLFSGPVDGQLNLYDNLDTRTQNATFFDRTVLSGPIVGPYPGNVAMMFLTLDPTSCTYTWQMVPYADGTHSYTGGSDPVTSYPSQVISGVQPIPELPGSLSFYGSAPVTVNPQIGLAHPEYNPNANAAFSSVGHGAFTPAFVSWSFDPGDSTTPANDACSGASFLFPSAEQDVSFATNDPSDPTPSCGTGDRSVWFFFVSYVDGFAQISTAGSGYSTVVSVHPIDPLAPLCDPAAVEVACGGGGASVPVQAYTAYRVQVRRSGGSGGTGALRVAVSVPEPSTWLGGVAALAALAQMRRARPRQ